MPILMGSNDASEGNVKRPLGRAVPLAGSVITLEVVDIGESYEQGRSESSVSREAGSHMPERAQ